MSNPKVSIILTTHGPAPYLKQAIGSVLAQTFEDWECLIVKDGIFKCDFHIGEALDCDRRFKTMEFGDIPDVSCRFAYTINKAFENSKGDYITYLCHDDLYLPWRLNRMVEFMDYRGVDACFGWQYLISDCHGKTNSEYVDLPEGRSDVRKGNSDQPAGTVDHSSVMHRRECFEKVGGWDENCPPRYGDAYFWMRLQNAGYKFHCIPEVLDCHRFNRESITWKEDHPKESGVTV